MTILDAIASELFYLAEPVGTGRAADGSHVVWELLPLEHAQFWRNKARSFLEPIHADDALRTRTKQRQLCVEETAAPDLFVVTGDGTLVLHKGTKESCETVKRVLDQYAAWVAGRDMGLDADPRLK